MFIVFEGNDGVGKSAQVEALRDTLVSVGIEVVTLNTPGGTITADALKDMCMYNNVDSMTRCLMMLAAIRDSYIKVIKPALREGKVVIADRWLWSNYLYQVVGEGVDDTWWKLVVGELFDCDERAYYTIIMKTDEHIRLGFKKEEHSELDKIPITEKMGEDFDTRVNSAISSNLGLSRLTKGYMILDRKEDSSVDELNAKVFNVLKYKLGVDK